MTANMSEVKLFIQQNIKEVKTVRCVSKGLRVSYDTLRKAFLRHENIPLGDYITKEKVQAMKQLLLNGDDPCFFVCYEYGYREDSGAKIFKKFTGMTMREFRNSVQNNTPRIEVLNAIQQVES